MSIRSAIEIDTKGNHLAELLCRHLGNRNLYTCLSCGTCSNLCPVSGQEDMDPRMLMQLIVEDQEEDALNTPWIWHCAHCGNCSLTCPMGIDLSEILHAIKSLKNADTLPVSAQKKINAFISTGNSSGIYPGEYLEFVIHAQNIVRKYIDIKDYKIPVDKKGARLLLLLDPEILKRHPKILADYALILDMAGEDWTISSVPIGTSNPALLTGRMELESIWQISLKEIVTSLGVDSVLIDDCQNRISSFGPFAKKEGFFYENIEAISLPILISNYLRKNYIKIKDKFNKLVAVQYPCGDRKNIFFKLFNELKENFFLKTCQMIVPSDNSTCCGGGLLRAGLDDFVKKYEQIKAKEINESSGDIVLTLCASCFIQLNRLKEKGLIEKEVLFLPECLAMSVIS